MQSNEASPITGGCACKAVRYRINGEPVMSLNCHCRDCQRASGSAYGPFMIVWKDDLEIDSDQLSTYSRLSEAGNDVERRFCRSCGSPVINYLPGRPKLVFVHAASLDEPEAYKPEMDIWTGSASGWDVMDSELVSCDGSPPVPDDFGR